MGKEKYYRYNPDTNNFERAYPTLRNRLGYWGRLLLGSCLIGGALFFVAYYCFSSPTEENLRAENAQLRDNLQKLNKRVGTALNVMGDIRERDDNIYRVLMQMEPMSADQRFSGVDHEENYASLSGLPDVKLLQQIGRRTALLEKSIVSQSASFDKIRESLAQNGERLRHIPAVLPINPEDYTVSSGYGNRIDPIYEVPKFHPGLDFPADVGDAVYATADGIVSYAADKDDYGDCIDIDHGYDYMTRYAHLSRILVKKGQAVKRGQKIGEVGTTGKSTSPHLHYEVRLKDKPQNPVKYYFLDITPEQYAQMAKRAEQAGQAMD